MGEQSAIDKVEAEISALNVKLEKLEDKIEEARAAGDKVEVAALREDKRQLCRKEELLREEKNKLHDKELLWLQRQPGALEILPAPAPSRLAHVSDVARLSQLRRRLPLCPRIAY